MPIGDIANTTNIALSGDVKVDSTKAKHGNKSVRFDGTGDFIETGLSDKYDHGVGDYTIEGWVYAETLGGNNVIASMDQDQTNFGVSQVAGSGSGTNELYIPFDTDLNDDAQNISADNVNSYGTPVVQSGQAKFGSASPFFTGNAGQLLLRYDAPDGEDFAQTGDFIIEGWVWQNGSASGGSGARNPRFFTLTNDSVTAGSNQNLFGQNIFISFGARSEGNTLTVAVKSSTDSASGTSFTGMSGVNASVGAYNTQSWRHFFLARLGSKLVVGYNGSIIATSTATGTLFSGATRFYLGGLPTSNTNAYNMFHAGYFDDVRFLSGTVNDYFTESVTTSDTYTVPTSALGLVTTEAFYLFAEDKITGNVVIQTSGTEYSANQWNYVSWARSSNNLSISLNGEQVASGSFAPESSEATFDATTFNSFTSPGTYTAPESGVYHVLAVGAGGGSSRDNGAGGAGGSVAFSQVSLTGGSTYSVVVGSGGASSPATSGNPGGDSSFAPGTPVAVTGSGGNGPGPSPNGGFGDGGSGGTGGGTGGRPGHPVGGLPAEGGTNGGNGVAGGSWGKSGGTGQGAPYGTALSNFNGGIPAPLQPAYFVQAGAGGGSENPEFTPTDNRSPGRVDAGGGGGGVLVTAPGVTNPPLTSGDAAAPDGADGGAGFGGGAGGGGESGPRGGAAGIDGIVLVYKQASAGGSGAPTGNKLKIGSGTAANTEWQGWMDEVRVTKGNARYGASPYSTPVNMHGGSAAMKEQRRRITLKGIPAAANTAAIAAAGSGSGTPVVIQAWGAGGGGRAPGAGGGGGYATAEYEIQSGVELHVLVGGGGRGGARAPSSLGENPIGGGGGSGQGGALVGVFTAPAAGFNPASAPTVDALHDAALVVAGSGGGGSTNHPSPNKFGGQGGGTTGGDGSPQQETPRSNHPSGLSKGAAGTGGTQTGGGLGGENFPFGVPSTPTGRSNDGGKLLGGNMPGPVTRGGGGAGYYGGGAGGQAPPNRSSSGGGGSGYFATTGLPGDIAFVAGTGNLLGGLPGLNGNPARRGGGAHSPLPGSAPGLIGAGGHSPGPKHAPGGPGYVVVTVDGSATEFSAPGSITIP